MLFRGRGRNAEGLGNVAAAVAAEDEIDDVDLPPRQAVLPREGLPVRRQFPDADQHVDLRQIRLELPDVKVERLVVPGRQERDDRPFAELRRDPFDVVADHHVEVNAEVGFEPLAQIARRGVRVRDAGAPEH